ncbi:MAG: cupin domain-containing protein [Planctomycetota bacterium]|nr:cupin domain-containing protein [Planctomycetota bacterium]
MSSDAKRLALPLDLPRELIPGPDGAPVDTGLRAPFEIANLLEVPGTPCPCGISRRAFTREDNRACTLHLVEIKADAVPHYHKYMTEVYYFLEGEGQIELDGQAHPVKPGMAVLLRPGVRHRAVSGGKPMKILNIVVPHFDPQDEWFD